MKKALIMTSVAFVLLLAVVAAGLNVIFTVSYIDASFSIYSEQGEQEAETLKKELDEFVGSSTTFLKLAKVQETVDKYPCFRMESVKKKFPKTIEVVVKERRELFAYQTDEGYAMIGADGNCLRMSDDNISRTGGENILLKNFELSVVVGERVQGNYFDALVSAFEGFETGIGDAKAIVRGVTLFIGGSANNPLTNFFLIEMQEGVVIEMSNPLSMAYEKAQKAMESYTALGDIAKMYGRITVTEGLDGNIKSEYFEYGEGGYFDEL